MKLALIVAVLLAVLLFGAAYAVDAPVDEPIEPAAVSYTGGLKAYMPIARSPYRLPQLGVSASASGVAQLMGTWPGGSAIPAGWFYDWWTTGSAAHWRWAQYTPLINVSISLPSPYFNTAAVVGAGKYFTATVGPYHPDRLGKTWIIGNEMDRSDQSPMSPQQYAVVYKAVRDYILGKDPTAKFAVGGLSQPTPIRLEWLETFINHYESLNGGARPPVDVWTIHGYAFSEQVGDPSSLPPNFAYTRPLSYSNGTWYRYDVTTFIDAMNAFRSWVNNNPASGTFYSGKPIWVSEFGILDSDITEAQVDTFIDGTCDWLGGTQTAIQRWAWFSAYTANNSPYGMLFDSAGDLTPRGVRYSTCF